MFGKNLTSNEQEEKPAAESVFHGPTTPRLIVMRFDQVPPRYILPRG
jgi:hypothetical protein